MAAMTVRLITPPTKRTASRLAMRTTCAASRTSPTAARATKKMMQVAAKDATMKRARESRVGAKERPRCAWTWSGSGWARRSPFDAGNEACAAHSPFSPFGTLTCIKGAAAVATPRPMGTSVIEG